MLTPSTAPLWTKCALSAQISRPKTVADVPPDSDPLDTAAAHATSEARREGVAAGWVANGVLRGDAATAQEFAGEAAPNGWIVTPDMVTHIQGYVDYCRSRGEIVRSEVPINIPHLFIRGRLDAHIVTKSSTLEIISLKYGWRLVEAEWNAQLLCEAIALWNPEVHDDVIMTVYQPRPKHPAGKVRSWEMNERDLTAAAGWLRDKALAATSPGAIGTPGGDYCRDCQGRGNCQALATATYAAFEWVRESVAGRLDAAALGDELRFLDEALELVKARHSGVKAEVQGRMRTGEYIPKWWIDIQLKDREFTVSPEEVEAKTGIEAYKKVPRSPAEMEREGADLETIDELTRRPFGGPKLVPATQQAFARMFKKPGKSHGRKR